MVTKTDFDAKLSSLNRKITSNKTKHLLVENELKKLKTFDLGYSIGKSHFDENGAQNYPVFQSMLHYFMLNSKGITNTLTPSINYYGGKVRLRFTGSVLQQKTATYNQKKKLEIFMWFTK